jgi:FKBP-type peptidyl-prolyl cis-trans isomerase FkpA
MGCRFACALVFIKANKPNNDRMNRILLFFLLLCTCFVACKKTNNVPAQIKAQLAVDDKIIVNYLQSNNLTALPIDSAGVSTGIRYIIDTLGSGNDQYTSATKITLGYQSTLLTTGKPVVSTDSFHPSYILGQTIRGWQFGIPKVKKGGTIRLFLPSHYAYGPFAQPTLGLPPNAILIFRITVYNITN